MKLAGKLCRFLVQIICHIISSLGQCIPDSVIRGKMPLNAVNEFKLSTIFFVLVTSPEVTDRQTDVRHRGSTAA